MTTDRLTMRADGCEYRIIFRADVEGDWTDHPTDGRDLKFPSIAAAEQWWAVHYRGPDEFGNRAYPEIVPVV